MFCGTNMIAAEQFNNSTVMENYIPFIFSPLKVYNITLLTCITYLCFHELRGNRQKNQTLNLQVRVEILRFFHKTLTHFLSNISALLQLVLFFFNFLMVGFRNCTLGAAVKSRKTTQKSFDRNAFEQE